MDALRERLSHIFKQRKDVTLKDASLRLGKAHQYLHQFVNGGSPKQLDLIMIIGLAEYLNIAVLELYPEATEQ